MFDFERPNIEVSEISEDKKYGKFVVKPLERGYGITLGNSLRRIMLSSLPGAAISSVKIDGVLHEFSSIPGVKEDVKQMYRMLCYSEMSLVYTDLFYSKISDSNNRYYNMSEMTDNYLTNIAQLRILGEEEHYDFYKNDGIFSGLVNLFNNSEEVRENTNASIKYIRKQANTLHLTLSNNMKYEV